METTFPAQNGQLLWHLGHPGRVVCASVHKADRERLCGPSGDHFPILYNYLQETPRQILVCPKLLPCFAKNTFDWFEFGLVLHLPLFQAARTAVCNALSQRVSRHAGGTSMA